MNVVDEAFERVQRFTAGMGLDGEVVESRNVIKTGFRTATGRFQTVIAVREAPLIVRILVRLPLIVPEHRRPCMAEALVRASFAMPLGRFEMNMINGDLFHTVSILLVEAQPTEEQFQLALTASMQCAATYHRAFARLVFDCDLSAAEIIAEVEMAAEEAEPAPESS